MSSPGTRSPSASLPEASKDAHAVPVFTEMLLCLPSSCFHSLSTPNWTSSVKKTYTHICSHLTNPPLTSVFIAPLECPFEPCASPLPTCEHGRAIQLPQEIRDFTETMIFELSVNICRGEFACRRGEQGMHKGGEVGGGEEHSHPHVQVLWFQARWEMTPERQAELCVPSANVDTLGQWG